jgi:calcineurin-like phosphoesterase family protein
MSGPLCSDEEFIALWGRLQSGEEVARALGAKIRGVMSRRRAIESRHGISLAAKPASNNVITSMQRAPETRWLTTLKDGWAVVFSDCHFWPGDRTAAFKALLVVIKELKPKLVVANGDVIDGATTSRHARSGWDRRPKLAEEIVTSKARLHEVRQAAPKAVCRWTIGNHDNRLDGWIANKSPELEGLPGTCLQEHFSDWPMSFSIHVNPDTNDHTVIKHRWKGGPYAIRNNTLNSGVHFVTGHLHQLRVWPHGDMRGRRYGVDTGTLAEIDADQFRYDEDSPKDWCSGFATLRYRSGMLLHPQICEVVRGHAYFMGDRVI